MADCCQTGAQNGPYRRFRGGGGVIASAAGRSLGVALTLAVCCGVGVSSRVAWRRILSRLVGGEIWLIELRTSILRLWAAAPPPAPAAEVVQAELCRCKSPRAGLGGGLGLAVGWAWRRAGRRGLGGCPVTGWAPRAANTGRRGLVGALSVGYQAAGGALSLAAAAAAAPAPAEVVQAELCHVVFHAAISNHSPTSGTPVPPLPHPDQCVRLMSPGYLPKFSGGSLRPPSRVEIIQE